MNLVEIEIQDFKQFHGIHRFAPGEQTMAAIVGANGAGKTTLFEALEWSLYGTFSGKNSEIHNRFQKGNPRVKVTLEDARGGERYEVERELKGSTTQVAVYSSANPSIPIVQGVREVARFVASRLTGLSSQAFVATFFTRQKELSFFGDMRPTERRREVGKLLGLETIRRSQERIAERRRAKRAEAESKERLRESESENRDIAAERTALGAARMQREAELRSARNHIDSVKETLESARATLNAQLAVERAYLALETKHASLKGTIDQTQMIIQTSEQTLQRISNAEREIERLTPQAGTSSELKAVVDRHRAAQRTAEQIRHTSRRIADRDDALRRLQSSLIDTVRLAETPIVPEWSTNGATIETFTEETRRMRAISSEIDLQTEESRCDLLARARDRAKRLSELASTLDVYRKQSSKYQSEIDALTSQGDPAARATEISAKRSELIRESASERSLSAAAMKRVQTLDLVRQKLQVADLSGGCPTCGRPFQPGESSEILSTLTEQIDGLQQDAENHRRCAEELDVNAAAEASAEQKTRADLDSLNDRRTRLDKGTAMIAEQRKLVDKAESELKELLANLDQPGPPSQSDLQTAQERLQALRKVAGQTQALDGLEQEFSRVRDERSKLISERASLGDDTYDSDAHQRDENAWEEATKAGSRIATLQEQIADRSSIEQQLSQARKTLIRHNDDLSQLANEQRDLSFDNAQLQAARNAEQTALGDQTSAQSALHTADAALTEVNQKLQDLDRFEQRLKRLATESIAARRTADDLERMYKEFSSFEQFVASTITPHLEELASDLLDTVTDGRYDRLVFSPDFGIEVYDGDQGPFTITQFSGGERDAISLCARLALSQLVGGKAVHPIQFLVLDEVFGALDENRRENVLAMLQKLVVEDEAIRQLFVISHIDEIRENGTLDEVWQVTETGHGTSVLERRVGDPAAI